jgi:hypothetical protein
MELSLFSKFTDFKPNTKKVDTRKELIKQFVNEINKERPCTYEDKNGKKKKIGLVSARGVAIKVSYLKEKDLQYFLSDCRSERARGKSFNKVFFGSLK